MKGSKGYYGSPTMKRRAVPLDKLGTIENIVTSQPKEPCPICGVPVPQDQLNHHVYNECDLKAGMDEVKSINDEREAVRELREILAQRKY